MNGSGTGTASARSAVVHGARSLREVRAYLPRNYTARQEQDGTIVVEGTDVAGWGLDTYVIPRLASGSMRAEEVA